MFDQDEYYEPEPICVCEACGEPMFFDDVYISLNGKIYHEYCFKEEAAEILFEDYGAIMGNVTESMRE